MTDMAVHSAILVQHHLRIRARFIIFLFPAVCASLEVSVRLESIS